MITAGLGDMMILSARLDGRMAAGVLIFRHGRGATYQAGWTSGEGRAVNAHHRLLWQAVTALKEDGALNFDLGGVNPRRAEGRDDLQGRFGRAHRRIDRAFRLRPVSHAQSALEKRRFPHYCCYEGVSYSDAKKKRLGEPWQKRLLILW